MLKIALCDDEKSQIIILNRVLSCYLDLQGLDYTIAHFSSGEEFLEGLTKEPFDIVFTDIEMGGLNGVEVAKSLRKLGHQSVLIFVTAYADFVFQGYEVKALNYILKPYKEQKIIDVLKSALEELKLSQDTFFPIPLKSGTYKLNLSTTKYFYSDKRKVFAVTSTKTIEFYSKLNDLEATLPSFFVRIHQRYLVNLNFIDHADTSSVLIGQEKLSISRAYSQSFMIAFAKTLLY